MYIEYFDQRCSKDNFIATKNKSAFNQNYERLNPI